MKIHILKFAVTLFVLAGIAVSCFPGGDPIEYPIEISFEEYSLQNTSCQWQNLLYNEKIIIINSNEELKKYISCVDEDYPAIDFSKHSLLLVSGKMNNVISEIKVEKLQQFAENQYKLDIEILYIGVIADEKWSEAIIIDKLSKDCKIEINTIKKIDIE